MEIKSYNNFWQRIHKSAKENGFPLRVMWELTYRCNFKCRHCYVPKSYKKKSRQELNTQEVFYILDQLADLGCFYLGFTGGEPFLREDIFDILWYAKKKGFQIIIYTNGSLIDKAKAEELKQLNPNKVDITIPAISKKAFEHITGVKRCRDKVFKAIGLLHKNGIKLGFKSCLLKVNENEIKEIQDFAASLGALHRLDNRLSPRLDGDREPYRYRGGLNEKSVAGNTYQVTRSRSCEIGQDYEKTKHEPRHACRQAGTTNHEPLFKCGVGVSQAAINPFGELKMCLMIDYPKYKILNKQVSGIRYQVSGNTSHVSGSTYQVAGNTSHVTRRTSGRWPEMCVGET
ncbi:MAG: radical SAM protein [Candidatus Omnitrophota bacterium]|nr:radical SAM protein [Candidatus Omnitrophota bacterium]